MPAGVDAPAASISEASSRTVQRALGNRAMRRVFSDGASMLAAQPHLATAAGNRALQRTPDEDETPPANTTQQAQQHRAVQQQAPGPADGGTPPLPESPYVTDNPIFHRGTQALDAVTGLAGARGGADFVGASDAIFGTNLGAEVADAVSPNLLPGAGLLTTVLGMGESAVRTGNARDRSRVMDQASGSAQGERAQQLLQLGAQEQTRERTRHTTRAGAGGLQSALMAGGLVAGVSTGGTVPLMAATAIGGMKVAETVYNLARRYFGKEASQRHAMQLLFAAQNGDASVGAALTQMGIPATSLEDPKVWQAAVERLGALMPQGEVEYEDDGAARSGSAVPIEQRRPLQPRLPGDQPYGSISSEDFGTSGNPLGGSGGAREQEASARQSILSIDTSPATARTGWQGDTQAGEHVDALNGFGGSHGGFFASALGGTFGRPPAAFGEQEARSGGSTPRPGRAPILPPGLPPSARAEGIHYSDSDLDEHDPADAVYMDDVTSDAESEADATAASGRRRKK